MINSLAEATGPWQESLQLSLDGQVLRRLTSDAHDWMNDFPTVAICSLAQSQPREWALVDQREKKTLLSLTLVRLGEMTEEVLGQSVSFDFSRLTETRITEGSS